MRRFWEIVDQTICNKNKNKMKKKIRTNIIGDMSLSDRSPNKTRHLIRHGDELGDLSYIFTHFYPFTSKRKRFSLGYNTQIMTGILLSCIVMIVQTISIWFRHTNEK